MTKRPHKNHRSNKGKGRPAKVQNSSFESVEALAPEVRARNQREAYDAMATGRHNEADKNGFPPHQYRTVHYYAELYHRHWEAKKLIDIPVKDKLRKPLKFPELDESQAKKFHQYLTKIQFIKKFVSAGIMERLLGGAAIYMGLAIDSEESLRDPLDLNNVGVGDLRYLNVVPRTQLSIVEWKSDSLSEEYEEPLMYSMNGTDIHYSRIIVFDGNPLMKRVDITLLDQNATSTQGFGESVLKNVTEEIHQAIGTRAGAYHLVNMASVLLMYVDEGIDGATKAGERRRKQVDDVMNLISIYRAGVIDRPVGQTGNQIHQSSASFGSVPELVMTFLEVICAAADIPATRFLGTAPSGLNTDGQSGLENYYGRLETEQQTDLRPQIQKFLDVAWRSFGGKDDIEFDFAPLWVKSDREQAETKKISAETKKVAVDSLAALSGIVSEQETLKLAEEWGIWDGSSISENI